MRPINKFRKWSPAEDAILMAGAQDGRTLASMSVALDRSYEAIKKRAQALGIEAANLRRKMVRNSWTSEDDNALLEMRSLNIPWAVVAKRLHRSEMSCQDRYWHCVGRADADRIASEIRTDAVKERKARHANYGACVYHLVDLMREFGGANLGEANLGEAKFAYRARCELDIEPEFEGRPTALPAVSAFDTMSVIGSQF